MGEKTGISWTDYTFNPWMGCEKVSPGCKNCYAETLTRGRMGISVWGKNPRKRTSAANWKKPLKWNGETPGARVFCASLADVFEDRPELYQWRNDLFDLIRKTPNLQWQILTKRPEKVVAYYTQAGAIMPENVWLGVSIESGEYAFRAVAEYTTTQKSVIVMLLLMGSKNGTPGTKHKMLLILSSFTPNSARRWKDNGRLRQSRTDSKGSPTE